VEVMQTDLHYGLVMCVEKNESGIENFTSAIQSKQRSESKNNAIENKILENKH
jgi:hypothetical protein